MPRERKQTIDNYGRAQNTYHSHLLVVFDNKIVSVSDDNKYCVRTCRYRFETDFQILKARDLNS